MIRRERVDGSVTWECMWQSVCEQETKLLDGKDAFIEFINVIVEGNERAKC